ncbi:MAG TPA: HD domain-containing protein [Patescibacteria group bacterium]
MNRKEIQKIEDELKALYYAAEGTHEHQDLIRSFWDHHVVPVKDLSIEMAEKYGADSDICWLGALFHDFALLSGQEPHDELGAIQTKDFLLERGFDEKFAETVSETVLRHRCKKFIPETEEDKVVATADAMAHFLPAFYLGIAVIAKNDYEEMKNSSFEKLEQDFQNKIFFEEEKKLLHDRMQEFRKTVLYK